MKTLSISSIIGFIAVLLLAAATTPTTPTTELTDISTNAIELSDYDQGRMDKLEREVMVRLTEMGRIAGRNLNKDLSKTQEYKIAVKRKGSGFARFNLTFSGMYCYCNPPGICTTDCSDCGN